jgi:hypothetical protein
MCCQFSIPLGLSTFGQSACRRAGRAPQLPVCLGVPVTDFGSTRSYEQPPRASCMWHWGDRLLCSGPVRDRGEKAAEAMHSWVYVCTARPRSTGARGAIRCNAMQCNAMQYITHIRRRPARATRNIASGERCESVAEKRSKQRTTAYTRLLAHAKDA